VTKENLAEKIRETFDKLDKDGNGTIDKAELKEALSSVRVGTVLLECA
jgi:Ca2+-binding EF-hand superfamily protein